MKNMPRAAEGLSIKAVVMKFLVKRKMRPVALISRCKKITFSCDSGKASFFQALQTNEESHIKSTKKVAWILQWERMGMYCLIEQG